MVAGNISDPEVAVIRWVLAASKPAVPSHYSVGPHLRADGDLERPQQSCQGLFFPRNEGDVIQDNGAPLAANVQDEASGLKQEILKDVGDLLVNPHARGGKTIHVTPKPLVVQ